MRSKNDRRENDIANLRSARIIKEVSLMTTIQLSENAETLLQRILDKRFLPGIKSITIRESMVEHLIIEEARRLKVIDMKEGKE